MFCPQDIILKNIPDGLPNELIAEYAAAAVERYENALLDAEQANLAQKRPITQLQIDGAKKAVDDFRKANSLQPKFEAAKIGE